MGKKQIDPRIQRSKIKYEGQIYFNNFGTPYKVIEYIKRDNVIIEFQDEYKYHKTTDIKSILNGNVLNPYDKNTFGVGYYGFDRVKNHSKLKSKQYHTYNVWHGMLERCYDNKYQEKSPTYKGCTVCDEWLSFKNFSDWYEPHYYEVEGQQMCIDKDILFKGNKIYSPQTCCIVPNEVNVLFTKTDKKRGKYPIGVHHHSRNKKYCAQCKIGGGKPQKYLGSFNTPEEAFVAYKIFKENYIKKIADKYKDVLEEKVYDALYNYKVEIND